MRAAAMLGADRVCTPATQVLLTHVSDLPMEVSEMSEWLASAPTGADAPPAAAAAAAAAQ